MNCETCGVALVERVSDKERPYHYTLSGLSNVYLVGIQVAECETCNHEVPTIQAPGQLHRELALAIIRKPISLAGEEVRYLRTYAGLTGRELAAMIPIDHTNLSKAENGRLLLGPSSDTALRAACLWKIDEKLFEEIFHREKESERVPRKEATGMRRFHRKGKTWEPIAA